MMTRWLIVLVTAVALVVTPLAVAARPAAQSSVSAAELAQRVQASADVSWSGFIESSGALQIPDSQSFANLANLLSESNRLRVWWRSPVDWRVDRIRSTGEADLYRREDRSIRWVFESATATIAPVSTVRLPDASDLLPPTLGRAMLQGSRADELSQLPAARVAGVDAAGLRLTPKDRATTVGHVDVWVDPASGLPLRVELYGAGEQRAVLSTSLLELDLGTPALATTRFLPTEGATVNYEDSVDVAASANAFAPFDLPRSLAGLPSRSGRDPGAVGVYGRGPTTLFALPLQGRVAEPLRSRLQTSASAKETTLGTTASLGPVQVLVGNDVGSGSFLLAGTVTAGTLQRAASALQRAQ